MTPPTIHRNGTGRDAILEGYINAGSAVLAAIRALCEGAPNARDYYPQGDGAFRAANTEHLSRLSRLETVLAELSTLAEIVSDAA